MAPKLALACLSLAIGAVSIGACTEDFPRESVKTAPPEDSLRVRPSNTSCVAPASPPGRIRLEPAWTGFTRPLGMIDRPDLGIVYVAEMPGRIKAIDRKTGAVTTALDLVGKIGGVPSFEDWALFGLAIHPTKPYAYVTVERLLDPKTNPELPYRTELVRFTLTDGGKTLDPASETLVLRVDRPLFAHFAGTVAFGPDGYLYVGIGDGAAAYVPGGFDTKGTLLGSIVRLDVDSAEPYAIPPDNPFASGGARPEIFALGFRNPWKFTFDRATGEIWAGDVGDLAFEEVDKVERGKNYGWPTLEGTACFKPRIGCDPAGLTPPFFVYPHADGAAVTGGYVYRGKAMPDLVGKYVFGDFNVGRIWALEQRDGANKAVLLNASGVRPMLASFGEDAEGELYALDWESGTVFRILAGAGESPPVMPARLSQTGCVDPADPKTPAPGLVPYDVNVELWSDGADKKRFVAIPDGKTLHVEDDGHIEVPEGGVLVKEFSVGGKRVETRLLMHHPGGEWTGGTYEWNDEQTDAVLLDAVKSKPLANGQTWTFPSPAQCFVCHTKASKMSLGLDAMQLHRDRAYGPGATTNQLAKLADIGYLDKRLDLAATTRLPELKSSAPIEDRARAYLHANCSSCHREGGGTFAAMDLRFTQPRTAIGICRDSVFEGVPDAKVVTPGDPSRSAIWLRMTNGAGYRMPPLGRAIVDQDAASVVEGWIRSLSACE